MGIGSGRCPDVASWIAYGGDFGEPEHDGNFVCDGLVSADRQPHPLLAELAALTQPVTVESAGEGKVRVHNRRWFRRLDDLEATWELTVDGRRLAAGPFVIPDVAPRSSEIVAVPAEARAAASGRSVLVVRFVPRRRDRPAWAPRRWVASLCVVEFDRSTMAAERPASPARREGTSLCVATTTASSPAMSSSAGRRCRCGGRRRTTTTRRGSGGRRRRRRAGASDGLDHIAESSVEISRRGRAVTRVVTLATATGRPIEHRQRVEALDGSRLLVAETITIDRALLDLPARRRDVRPAGRLRPARLARARSRRLLPRPPRRCSLRPLEGRGRRSRRAVRQAAGVRPARRHGVVPARLAGAGAPCRRRPSAGVLGAAALDRRAAVGDARPPPAADRRRRTSTSMSPTAASARRRADPTPTAATWWPAAPTASRGR